MRSDLKEWKALQAHAQEISSKHINDMFAEDKGRFRRMSLKHGGMTLDYSKNLVTAQTMDLLLAYAAACDLEIWREKMFNGHAINKSEDRAVLHTALRAPDNYSAPDANEDVMKYVTQSRDKMQNFCKRFHGGEIKGYSEKPINTVVNIGIGGSDLGPRMVCNALKSLQKNDISVRFVSNIDGAALHHTLSRCDPERTLFLIASKSFTTQETMMNAQTAKEWLLLNADNNKDAVKKHFVALSSNERECLAFGITPDNIFTFRDWVGGRFSLWSAAGLSIPLAIGFENFEKIMQGAYFMDCHFREAPLSHNMPVLLGLIGFWYRSFMGAKAYAVLPYAEDLEDFPTWLQQLDMESNGKQVDRSGKKVNYKTGPIVFGASGTNGQHAFYQLLHQGTDIVPCDFIGAIMPAHPLQDHHELLLYNMIAQSKALMCGDKSKNLPPEKHFEGNRPSNTILLETLDPFHLGMLLALYEHKIFVQGILWNINSFDQFGVELGKTMTRSLEKGENDHDESTKNLLSMIRTHHIS